jgi:hypothetical protein
VYPPRVRSREGRGRRRRDDAASLFLTKQSSLAEALEFGQNRIAALEE